MSRTSPHSQEVANALQVAAEYFEDTGQPRQAFKSMEGGAALMHTSCMVNLGNYYASGYGTKKDLKRAEYWYRKAYRRGSSAAAYNLASTYLQTNRIPSAIVWFKRGIQKNDGDAFIALAKIYMKRKGGGRKAAELLQQVSKLSRSDASELDQEEAIALLQSLQVPQKPDASSRRSPR